MFRGSACEMFRIFGWKKKAKAKAAPAKATPAPAKGASGKGENGAASPTAVANGFFSELAKGSLTGENGKGEEGAPKRASLSEESPWAKRASLSATPEDGAPKRVSHRCLLDPRWWRGGLVEGRGLVGVLVVQTWNVRSWLYPNRVLH